MKAISIAASFLIGSWFALATAMAQQAPQKPVAGAMNVLIGNATANDVNAVINDKFAELMTKYSGGRLKASARHGGALGSIAQMVSNLQAGAIQGMVTPAGNVATAVPELSLFDLPFLLAPATPANITAFTAQSKAAARMKEIAEQKGIHIIAFHGIGPVSFLTRMPMNKLSDIQGKKFRVISSPPRIGAYEDWGAVARPMDFAEVYTALQQGNLDGSENPPDVTYRMKFFEVAKYYTITGHFAFVSNIIVSKKWFDGLPKDLRDIVTRAGMDTVAFADEVTGKSQDSSLESLRQAISVTTLPAAELQKMKDLARKGVWARMRNDSQKGPIVKLLEADVARYSSK